MSLEVLSTVDVLNQQHVSPLPVQQVDGSLPLEVSLLPSDVMTRPEVVEGVQTVEPTGLLAWANTWVTEGMLKYSEQGPAAKGAILIGAVVARAFGIKAVEHLSDLQEVAAAITDMPAEMATFASHSGSLLTDVHVPAFNLHGPVHDTVMITPDPLDHDGGGADGLQFAIHYDNGSGKHDGIAEQVGYALFDAAPQELSKEERKRVGAYTQWILDHNGIDVAKGEDRHLADGREFFIPADEMQRIDDELGLPHIAMPLLEPETHGLDVSLAPGPIEIQLSDGEVNGERPLDTLWEGVATDKGLDNHNLSLDDKIAVDALTDGLRQKYGISEEAARHMLPYRLEAKTYVLTVEEQNRILADYGLHIDNGGAHGGSGGEDHGGASGDNGDNDSGSSRQEPVVNQGNHIPPYRLDRHIAAWWRDLSPRAKVGWEFAGVLTGLGLLGVWAWRIFNSKGRSRP